MFKNNTAFILGAGGSWHYGYPTGEDLVRKAIACAQRLAGLSLHLQSSPFFPGYIRDRFLADKQGSRQDMVGAWTSFHRECKELAARLRHVNPPVIDYFLGQNRDIEAIGRLVIAWVILECESQWMTNFGNQNRREMAENSGDAGTRNLAPHIDITKFKDDWYRFVLYKLVSECRKSGDLLDNRVAFITFNYDVSLELYLDRGLRSISLFTNATVDKFFAQGRFLHVYGSVREFPDSDFQVVDLHAVADSISARTGQNHGPTNPQIRFKDMLDQIYAASKAIRVIDPADKGADKAVQRTARNAIEKAGCVYILGYGFDENNNKRLGMDQLLRKPAKKCVMFTNYDDSNLVNKRASKLFFGTWDDFLPHKDMINGDPTESYYEKSVRDVYGALERDFDYLETELIASTPI